MDINVSANYLDNTELVDIKVKYTNLLLLNADAASFLELNSMKAKPQCSPVPAIFLGSQRCQRCAKGAEQLDYFLLLGLEGNVSDQNLGGCLAKVHFLLSPVVLVHAHSRRPL